MRQVRRTMRNHISRRRRTMRIDGLGIRRTTRNDRARIRSAMWNDGMRIRWAMRNDFIQVRHGLWHDLRRVWQVWVGVGDYLRRRGGHIGQVMRKDPHGAIHVRGIMGYDARRRMHVGYTVGYDGWWGIEVGCGVRNDACRGVRVSVGDDIWWLRYVPAGEAVGGGGATEVSFGRWRQNQQRAKEK